MKQFTYLLLLAAFTITAQAQPRLQKTDAFINNFTVYENNQQLIFNWSSADNVAANVWKIQRSTDKVQFSTIALVLGNDPGQPGNQYAYKEKLKDNKKVTWYFRICHVTEKGEEAFSNILTFTK